MKPAKPLEFWMVVDNYHNRTYQCRANARFWACKGDRVILVREVKPRTKRKGRNKK